MVYDAASFRRNRRERPFHRHPCLPSVFVSVQGLNYPLYPYLSSRPGFLEIGKVGHSSNTVVFSVMSVPTGLDPQVPWNKTPNTVMYDGTRSIFLGVLALGTATNQPKEQTGRTLCVLEAGHTHCFEIVGTTGEFRFYWWFPDSETSNISMCMSLVHAII